MAGPSSSSGSPLLSVRDVSVRFGGIVALDGVTFDVVPGQIAGLIGPNGAGKTTLFNCLSAASTCPTAATSCSRARSILAGRATPSRSIGIGRTFQNVALFDRMSVLDNVKVGCHSRSLDGLHRPTRCACPRSSREERAHHRARRGADRLHGPRAVHARARPAACRSRSASASSWRARSPASPKLLLLDEPAAGLNHDEVDVLRGPDPARARHAARDRAAGRASHEPGHVGLRQGRRHRLRQEDRRRHAGGGAARSRSDPRLSGTEASMMAALLEVKGSKAYYGQTQALHDVGFALETGGITTLLGANGAGKTTTLRAICNMVRTEGAIRFDGKDDRRHGRPRRSCAWASRHVPEGRGTFTNLTRRREPARRRLHAHGQGRGRSATSSVVFEYFPQPQGARPAAGRHAVGRRAADAGDQPRADAGAAPDAARRAVVRPGAADRAGDLPHHAPHQRARRR